MNTTLKVLCTHCGRLIPEAESDAHCATHEKTPIPAVASEGIELTKCPTCGYLGASPCDIQRAQADALDARRYRMLRNSADECYVLSISVAYGLIGPTTLLQGSNLDAAIDASIDDAALRTSSPDPVVPRGEQS